MGLEIRVLDVWFIFRILLKPPESPTLVKYQLETDWVAFASFPGMCSRHFRKLDPRTGRWSIRVCRFPTGESSPGPYPRVPFQGSGEHMPCSKGFVVQEAVMQAPAMRCTGTCMLSFKLSMGFRV